MQLCVHELVLPQRRLEDVTMQIGEVHRLLYQGLRLLHAEPMVHLGNNLKLARRRHFMTRARHRPGQC